MSDHEVKHRQTRRNILVLTSSLQTLPTKDGEENQKNMGKSKGDLRAVASADVEAKEAAQLSKEIAEIRAQSFTEAEANRFFGRPDPSLAAQLSIRLRPPVDVRAEFTARHAELIARL